MKLHPLSVPYRAVAALTRLAWILLFATFGSQQAFGLTIALGVVTLGLAVTLAYQYVYVQRFDYELTDDTLDIRSGVLSRRAREIPYGRVQNVDLSQNLVQRALGISEVRVETAGGGDTEAQLRFVSETEASRLQREIGRLKRGETATEPDTEVVDSTERLYAISPTELALLGVVKLDLRLLSFVVALVPLFVPSVSEMFPLYSLFTVAPFLLVGLAIVSLGVSSVVGITNYYGFTLWRSDGELRYERGLLQRYTGTIPLDKVQSVAITESVLARRLGYASLEVKTAGYAPGEGSGSQSAVPIAERARVQALARQVEPFGDLEFERPPKRARLRYLVRYSLVVAVLVAVAYGVTRVAPFEPPFPWFSVTLLAVLVPPAAHLKWKNLGVALADDHVVTRGGFWTRSTKVVPYYRIQTLVQRETVFQRRRDLATLVIDTAGSTGIAGSDARALDIDADRASELRETLDDRLHDALVSDRLLRLERRQRREALAGD
ncbi:PH domain-containing protein [Halorarius litoreus]|uniref:PH domain-containing protein n=1 Tax=Halorarius litoreus TaxID=2962676 RepID=UPI0020CD2F77|nr:PH domain-containing protein [Halorarius litoreus]